MLERTKKIQKAASLCLSLTMVMSVAPVNVFASAPAPVEDSLEGENMKFKLLTDESLDELEDLAMKHLISLGYTTQGEMSYARLKLSEWSFVNFGIAIEKKEIERLVGQYGEEVIGLTFSTISCSSVNEEYFKLIKYMTDNNCVKGLSTARVLSEVEELLSEGNSLESLDLIEISFRKLFRSFCYYVGPDSEYAGKILYSIAKREFDDYNSQIGDMEISEKAKVSRQNCLDLIEEMKGYEI